VTETPFCAIMLIEGAMKVHQYHCKIFEDTGTMKWREKLWFVSKYFNSMAYQPPWNIIQVPRDQ
jgi:hypothetical protein